MPTSPLQSGLCNRNDPDTYLPKDCHCRTFPQKSLGNLYEVATTTTKIPVRAMLAFLIITINTAAVLEFCLTNYSCFNADANTETPDINDSESSIKFSIYPPVKAGENHLQHVVRLLEALGYTQTSINELDWNLLWAHEYPFRNISEMMRRLLPHQTVNHIPGIGFLTSKVDLSTASLPFMPKAFRLPQQKEEFLKHTSISPDTLFVEKHNKHRDIKICSPNSINLSSTETFLQEFIENPFLVDGYKFDIGVYVVITSVDPLLSYIYTGDVLFRYCSEKYLPFDPKNVNKYVVGNDYVPTWKVPSLIKYFETFGGGMRASFNAYVRDQSLDPSDIWTQVEHIVRETILAMKNNIVMAMRPYKTGNFFELLRFDLIIDDELKVHLMEINMSPNLSSEHFKQNALLYEQILYSVFNLLGVGTALRAKKW